MMFNFFQKRHKQQRPLHTPITPTSNNLPPQLEPLEPRLLLSGTHFVVNSLQDIVAPDDLLTLREAIYAANNNIPINEAPAGSATDIDLITFNQTALERESAISYLKITLNGTQLSITDDLTIQGLGKNTLAINANNQSRVLSIYNNANVQFNDLAITGGNTPSNGAGIEVDSGTLTLNTVAVYANKSIGASGDGGGIYNKGTLNVFNSQIYANHATGNPDTGNTGSGGGIYNYRGTLNIDNLAVSGNAADYGGGIYNKEGDMTLANSYIIGNTADEYGGGIENHTGTMTLTHTTVYDNHAPGNPIKNVQGRGGGIYNLVGTAHISNSTIIENSTQQRGGGIYVGSNGTLNITDSTVSDNFAQQRGAGLYLFTGTLNINNTTISGNTADERGGGVYNYQGAVTINTSNISQNFALEYGGGIYQSAGTLNINNSTLASNRGQEFGGGFYHSTSTANINNSVFVANTSNRSGAAIYSSEGALTITNSTITKNASETSTGGIRTYLSNLTLNNTILALNTSPEISGTYTNNTSIIYTNPLFIQNPTPGPDNIWATPDDNLGDLRLQSTSFAINTGNNNLIPIGLTLDVAGLPRIYNNTVDIGAHEYTMPGDFNNDQTSNINDADLLSAAINSNSQEQQFDLNNDGALNALDGQYLITNILNSFPADFNLDYQVDVADLSTWATGFGQTSAVFSQGDSNFDGQVDVADLSSWATNFGNTSTPPPSPLIAPVNQPLTSQESVADNSIGFILDASPTNTPTHAFITPESDPFSTPGQWDNIKNLLSPTSSNNKNIDIIKNISTPI